MQVDSIDFLSKRPSLWVYVDAFIFMDCGQFTVEQIFAFGNDFYIIFDMSLKLEEQMLIKDIFSVEINQSQYAGIDSLLMERLQTPQTETLAYLEQAWAKAESSMDKPWNNTPESKQFIETSIETIKNFIILTLNEPEFFPEQVTIDPNASKASNKTQEIAMKVLSHIERRGYNDQLIRVIADGIGAEFFDELLQVLLARQRFLTILDPKAFTYISLFMNLLSETEIREKFMAMKEIAGQSPFELFLRLSVLGQKPGHYHQQNEALARFQSKLVQQMGGQRLSRETMKRYTNLQGEYYNKVTEAYKLLLRKSTQKPFLEWNYRLLIANMGRTKLAARLANADNSAFSHDGILVNAFHCFLNLSKVIISRDDDKYKLIDPTYFRDHEKASVMKYDPINSKGVPKYEGKKDFGTISEFFFLSLQFLHVGVVGAIDIFEQLNETKKRYEREIGKIPQNHPMYKKAQLQVAKLQSRVVRYYILLFHDEVSINTTIKLLDLLIDLLPQWLGFSIDKTSGQIRKQNNGELAQYLPQFLLTIISKYHYENFKNRTKESYLVGRGQHIQKVLHLICFLLSDQTVVSNPYVAADYIQLLFMFLHDNKAGVMGELFRGSKVAHRNLTEGLIKFYCNIAITGRSSAFYEKFKYRFYANKIFTSLWAHEEYRENLKLHFNSPIFEKFLNMVMTDTTYCFDEVNENYKKFRELEAKKAEGPLSAEDLKNEQTIERIIGSTLNQSSSNLKLMRDLSKWSPQTFLTEVDRQAAVPLLNNILKTFVDPGAFAANRQLVNKFKFQRASALSDLVQIYANLNINHLLSSTIVKDTRNYRREYFSQALQKASNQHHTSIDTLETFERLITQLSTAEDEEEEDEEIFGEIPDKYLDPIMGTLMKDPVLLPGSREIVDRVTIHRALLDIEQDPFTRHPLKESEVIPQTKLKEQIQVWKKKRSQQLKNRGKQVKYGKIAASLKQENEGRFNSNNPVIEQE